MSFYFEHKLYFWRLRERLPPSLLFSFPSETGFGADFSASLAQAVDSAGHPYWYPRALAVSEPGDNYTLDDLDNSISAIVSNAVGQSFQCWVTGFTPKPPTVTATTDGAAVSVPAAISVTLAELPRDPAWAASSPGYQHFFTRPVPAGTSPLP